MNDLTYNIDLIGSSRGKWLKSRALRLVYGDCFQAMRTHAIAGRALEIGSGIGVLKDFIPGVITSDIRKTEYVDRAISAYEIKRAGEAWETIYAFDVLHHLCDPLRFFESASDALSEGGRLVLMEPAASVGGMLFYKMFHHEPIVPGRIGPPYVFVADKVSGEFANMGMGWALFMDHRRDVGRLLERSGLRVVSVSFRDGLAYAATGGFSAPQLLPTAIIRLLLRFERHLPQVLWRYIGLRMMIVLEKKAQ